MTRTEVQPCAAEVIPRRRWKSRISFASRPSKTSINRGTQGVHARHEAVFLPFIQSYSPPVVQSHRQYFFHAFQSYRPPPPTREKLLGIPTEFRAIRLNSGKRWGFPWHAWGNSGAIPWVASILHLILKPSAASNRSVG